MSVLVPIDGSELALRALRVGGAIAAVEGSELIVLTIVADSAAIDRRKESAMSVAQDLTVPIADFVAIQSDDPAAVITRVAGERNAAICMASHGHSGLGRVLLGSVTEAVIRQSARPVVIVGPACDPATDPAAGRLGILTDGSHASDRVSVVAVPWIRSFGVDATVLSIAEPDGPPTAAGSMTTDVADSAAAVRLSRAIAEEVGRDVDFDVLHGAHVAETVADYVRTNGITMLAASTHGRTGLERVTMGSTAMAIVHDSPVPVLVHRPLDRLRN